MNIVKATSRFEEWLDRHIVLVKEDLRLKHEQMARSAFPFFRATFYRWIQIWPEICSVPADAPRVLAVGDLHVENFGTWRDVEGRLIWGVNDFDEATVQPFTVDLIRLATSVLLASREGHLRLPPKDACQAILDGYVESLAGHGRPFVLAEQNVWLRDIATNVLRDPEHFWQKMDSYPTVRSEVPASAVEALEHLMPEPGLEYRLARRVAGLGSLGHIRLVAIAPWRGGRVARGRFGCRAASGAKVTHYAVAEIRNADAEVRIPAVARAIQHQKADFHFHRGEFGGDCPFRNRRRLSVRHDRRHDRPAKPFGVRDFRCDTACQPGHPRHCGGNE